MKMLPANGKHFASVSMCWNVLELYMFQLQNISSGTISVNQPGVWITKKFPFKIHVS